MPNRRQRRSAAQAHRLERSCDVPYCELTAANPLSACPHVVCNSCVFLCIGALEKDHGEPGFGFKCPLCREPYKVDAQTMKTFMATYASSREKTMPCCCDADCGKSFVVMHTPCEGGCYECAESTLTLEQVHDSSDDSSVETSTGAETDAETDGAEPPSIMEADEEAIADIAGISLQDMD